MKRDMDLLRSILLLIESELEPGRFIDLKAEQFLDEYPSLTNSALREHVFLLREAGYLKGGSDSLSGISQNGLTNRGYDYLDTVRNPEIWRNARDAGEKAGGFTLSLIGEIASGLIKTKIKKHTGVELSQ